MSRLKDQKITAKARFRIVLPSSSAKTLLAEAYKQEVESRGGVFSETADLAGALDAVSRSLTNEGEKPRIGMMLYGYTGNGKTTTLKAMSRVIHLCQRALLCPMQFGTLGIFDAGDIIRIASGAEWDSFKNSPLLAIDDFGKESTEVNNYGNISSPMIELLEYRYRKQLYTVISSNMDTKDIRIKYGQRIADRFNEMLDVVNFKGNTFRR